VVVVAAAAAAVIIVVIASKQLKLNIQAIKVHKSIIIIITIP
jgi:hypothetical protein